MAKGNAEQLIPTLCKLLAANPPEGADKLGTEQIEQLLRIYYRHISPADLDERDPQDLLGALIAQWHLMRHRRPDQATVRVYNPEQEEHGWRSKDTIVEVNARDMPFLVDSIAAALNRRGLTISLTIHPMFEVDRDSRGTLTGIHAAGAGVDASVTEAVVQMHIERQPQELLQEIQDVVAEVIDDVTATTSDWAEMKQRAEQIGRELQVAAGQPGGSNVAEANAFLNWMVNDHFLFIAVCTLELHGDPSAGALRFAPDSGLGLLRDATVARERVDQWVCGIAVDLAEFRHDLIVTKANARSRVHRPAYMDCVAIKRRDRNGQVIALDCLIGLFSSSAYKTPPRQIPLLRTKVDAVFAGAQVSPNSHYGRAIANILDDFPRDALFQIGTDDLLNTTLGLMSLQERQRTRLFVVRDPFRRFYTCLVYLPRERYSREVRIAVQGILVDALGGTDVVFGTHFSESILARMNFVIRTPVGFEPSYDTDELEATIVEVTTSWQDGLRTALLAQVDEAMAARYLSDYGQAFPGGYREDYHPRIAVNDIQRIERTRESGRLALHLYQPLTESNEQIHVRLYSHSHPVSLSQAIPVLENMGLQVFGERPYRIRHPKGDIWIHDFATRRPTGTDAIAEETRQSFIDTFLRVWDNTVDNDGFNGLILRAGLKWKEALLFRAYSRYLHQIKAPYTQTYTVSVLNRHPEIVRVLNRLFRHRFNPLREKGRADREETLLERFESMLERVARLDEDRILRSFLNLVQATLRTNFFQRDANGDDKHYLSFKFDPKRVSGMPPPLPMFEIFVFSAQMEGVHLRGGRVARGGLRWSDRMEDYRTEILGLVKAQMVKNTVIVPAGSKGGFVVKDASSSDSREQRLEKGIACYRTLLKGMLDLTDNLVGNNVVPPPDLVRKDDDDPYLVIAADKGTATFSDIANRVSADYEFWLGDAFASGGSAGYDHKAMGITARGAWESVKRNFRELGVDTQTTDFTVIGIGDMSGDVFGNGMLLSRHIRLVGAFNHQHIFLDPDPDAATSFVERERLFQLPRSNWADYDRALISAGGGVHSREAKSIALTPEVQTLLGVKAERLPPNELIRAMLMAKVDLLWNGGIGTYVKAAHETHEQAHDKANDALRVDAANLRCRVIGEGGNLGLTQLGRVEFAMHGGQIYTDAIDNSAGVDCSDHEVNIKILLDKVVANGDMTIKQRNALLADMTDDVARLVLRDNYAQTQAISVVVSEAARRLYEQARFIDLQEQRGAFNRRLEGLPDRKVLTERLALGQGLTKPEVSVLLAYSKMAYYEAIINSDIPDDPFVADHLVAYFPPVLGSRFPGEIAEHRLRREIIATTITSSIADHVGPGIGFRVREEVGSDIASVARAYLVVSEVFETDRLWHRIEELDNQVPATVQTKMLASIAGFLERTLTTLLRVYKGALDMRELRDHFHHGVAELSAALPKPLASREKADYDRSIKRLVANGVPRDLAQSVAGLRPLSAALDIVDVARAADATIETTAWIHSALGHALELDWIREHIDELAVQSHWHLLARTKLHAALDGHHRALAAEVLCSRTGGNQKARGIFEHWQRKNHDVLARHEHDIAEFKAGGVFDFAILSLAVAGVGELLPSGLAAKLAEN